MITVPIEPFWEKLQEHWQANEPDVDFWEWLRRDYDAYQVYIVSNPTAVGEEKGCGIMFSTDEEATWFTLKWS